MAKTNRNHANTSPLIYTMWLEAPEHKGLYRRYCNLPGSQMLQMIRKVLRENGHFQITTGDADLALCENNCK